jgi:hypothetical protein
LVIKGQRLALGLDLLFGRVANSDPVLDEVADRGGKKKAEDTGQAYVTSIKMVNDFEYKYGGLVSRNASIRNCSLK